MLGVIFVIQSKQLGNRPGNVIDPVTILNGEVDNFLASDCMKTLRGQEMH